MPIGSLTWSITREVWQMIHRPSRRHSAPGGGGGVSVLGSTVGPAAAGAPIQMSPASARTLAITSARSGALPRTASPNDVVWRGLASLRIAGLLSVRCWLSSEARQREGPPEPGQPWSWPRVVPDLREGRSGCTLGATDAQSALLQGLAPMRRAWAHATMAPWSGLS